MPRRRIWSARQRAALFDLPADEAALLRRSESPFEKIGRSPRHDSSNRDNVHGHDRSGTIDESRRRSRHGAAGAGVARAHLGTSATMPALPKRHRQKRAKARPGPGRCAHHALRPSRTTPARSRSLRRFFGDIWCAGPTSRTCEQVPGPAAMPAETCSREFCTAGAVR